MWPPSILSLSASHAVRICIFYDQVIDQRPGALVVFNTGTPATDILTAHIRPIPTLPRIPPPLSYSPLLPPSSGGFSGASLQMKPLVLEPSRSSLTTPWMSETSSVSSLHGTS